MKHSTPEEWCDFAKIPHSLKAIETKAIETLKTIEKFIADHKHEFDVMDMIVNHAGEVNLDEITAANA